MARISKDLIDVYYFYGIDRDNRRIFLDGEITQESSQNIRRGILYLDSLSHEKPIELWICSEGGDEYCTFSIYDTLRTVKCPVHTIATGMCFSAAPLLVAAGTVGERYITPHCWMMVHQTWFDHVPLARIDEHKRTLEHSFKVCEQWYNLMGKHTKLSAKQWMQKCNRIGDYYFDAEKAVEYGLVDQLWSEKDE
jgi:ATP-dependent Clp protease protease subunit